MDKNSLQPEQIEPVQKKGKVLKIVVIILLAIFVLALILYFRKPHLSVTVNTVDKKDSYKLGDTILLNIDLKNNSILPFKNEFSPDSQQLSVEGVEPKAHLSSRAVPVGSTTESIDQIKPFESRWYNASINLVNEKSWQTYAGELSNYDLVVKPGKNTINARWYKQASFDIYIAPENFYEDKIDCGLFVKPNRQDQCYSDLVKDGVQNDEICRMFNQNHLKTMCYSELAKQKEDISICDALSEGFDRKSCVAKVTGHWPAE